MTLRRNVLALLAAMVAAVMLTAVPALGATAFTVSGTRILHDPPFPDQLLPDYFAGDTISRIDYPAALLGMDRSIAVAVDAATTDLRSTPGPVIVSGLSQGAVAVAHVKDVLMALPAAQRPAPDQLSFVTIGDPAGPHGILHSLRFLPFRIPGIGLTPITAPDTPYDSVIVNGEYDGWADFPDRPWRLLSVLNALIGTAYVHGGYETVPGGLDLSAVPPGNITTTVNTLGGTTTTYLIPTEKLPLVQPLRDLGVSEKIVSAVEKPLKTLVDKGYRRNDPTPKHRSARRAAPSAAHAGERTTRPKGRTVA